MNQAGIDALKAALDEAVRRATIERPYLNGIQEKLTRSSRDYEKSMKLVTALTEAIRNAQSESGND